MTEYVLPNLKELAVSLHVPESIVATAVQLLDSGYTINFIIKSQQLGAINLVTLREIAAWHVELQEVVQLRAKLLQELRETQQITPDLEQKILNLTSKPAVNDIAKLYRAEIHSPKNAILWHQFARDVLRDATNSLETQVQEFIATHQLDISLDAAMRQARTSLVQKFITDWELKAILRDIFWQNGSICVHKQQNIKKFKKHSHKYTTYFGFVAQLQQVSPHRAYEIFQGKQEGILSTTVQVDNLHIQDSLQQYLAPYASWQTYTSLYDSAFLAFRQKLCASLSTDMLVKMRHIAAIEAIRLLSNNVRQAIAIKSKSHVVTMGLDLHANLGINIAVVDTVGNCVETAVIVPNTPYYDWYGALATMAKLASRHHVRSIAIDNGNRSPVALRVVNALIAMYPDLQLHYQQLTAFPVTINAEDIFARAIFTARRLQAPVDALVAILPVIVATEDIPKEKFMHAIHASIQDFVSQDLININTASLEVLSFVPGLNATLAKCLVDYRALHGPFDNLESLQGILNPIQYEQAYCFLKVRDDTRKLKSTVTPKPKKKPTATPFNTTMANAFSKLKRTT